MSEIGVRPSRRAYRVGEYELESDPEGEGPGWQDFIGKHQSITGDYVRARRYLVAAAIRDDEQRWLRRAAEREYRVLCALRHPSILQAKQFVDHELGPTLLFEWRDGTRRLDLFIAESGSRLAIGSKLDILRRLADALRYAHRKNVVHRALSPKCVLIENPEAVIERGADPELRVAGWQVALRLESIDSASTYTRHIEEFTEASDRIYLAPELRRDPERARGASVDVFSLGALSFLVLAGRPPAASDRELDRLLRERGALDLAAVVDGVGTSLRDLVLYSTSADPSSRFETADEFLEQLGDVEEELTAPPSEDFIDPLEAKQGNVLKAPELLRTPYEAGFRVETVLGRGSTAIALAVRRLDGEGRANGSGNGNGKRNGNGKGNEGGNGNESSDASPPPSGKSSAGQPLVLKVALDESRSDALRGEADALRLLRHDCIVGLVDELVLCQRTALLLEHAGDSTLRDLLRAERSLSLDYLHRYGEELLRAVLHLEEKGVPHRDIKPDN
ncbi:MAG TPA: protein kinase, partial [Planctomycetota bacterium]|nr:protein kinase [Planctomycetota bacterium]